MQQKILDMISTEEVDRFFDATVFAEYENSSLYKMAMIYGMCIAGMMTSSCEPIWTDDKKSSKVCETDNGMLHYGEIAKCEKCSVHFESDDRSKDVFLIKDENGNVIGEFEETIRCKNCANHRYSDRNLWCDIFDKILPEDGYCCFGEGIFKSR